MSLYSEYLKERTNDFILERDEGFATYRFLPEKTVYIVDIYVRPEFRKSGIAGKMADEIGLIAKIKGCEKMIGSVVASAKNSTASMKVLLAYGMTLKSSGNDFIIFERGL